MSLIDEIKPFDGSELNFFHSEQFIRVMTGAARWSDLGSGVH